MCLQVAVPMWQMEFQSYAWDQLRPIAQRAAEEVGSHGDILQFGSKKAGAQADVFNHLAKGIAVLSFCPGGVKFLGDHYEAQHA
jgi:hypothetical protein